MTKLKQHFLNKIRSDIAKLASSLKEGGSYHAITFQHLSDRLQNAKNPTEAAEIFQYMPPHSLSDAASFSKEDSAIYSEFHKNFCEFIEQSIVKHWNIKSQENCIDKIKACLGQLSESLKSQNKPQYKTFQNALSGLNQTKNPLWRYQILKELPEPKYEEEAKFNDHEENLFRAVLEYISLVVGSKPKGPLEAADVKIPKDTQKEITEKIQQLRSSPRQQNLPQTRLLQNILERIELAELDSELQSALDDFSETAVLDSDPSIASEDKKLFEEAKKLINSLTKKE